MPLRLIGDVGWGVSPPQPDGTVILGFQDRVSGWIVEVPLSAESAAQMARALLGEQKPDILIAHALPNGGGPAA